MSSTDDSVVAYTHSDAFLSRDGGQTFAAVAFPKNTQAIGSVALAETAVPWASFAEGNAGFDVARLPAGQGWTDVAGDSASVRQSLGLLVPVGVDRIIEVFPNTGYRCLATTGGPWLSRCPPA